MYRFIWKIKLHEPAKEQEFIDHWRKGSTILQKYPGALGTHLHRVRGEEGCFFAVAEWGSREARDFMQADSKANQSALAKEWNALPRNESFGEGIAFFGDEVGKVLPS